MNITVLIGYEHNSSNNYTQKIFFVKEKESLNQETIAVNKSIEKRKTVRLSRGYIRGYSRRYPEQNRMNTQ